MSSLFTGTNESATRAYDFMVAVMAELVAAYEELNTTPPDRRYIWIGSPAVDCEQLVVSYNRIYTGTPGQESNDITYLPIVQRVVEMSIEVHRCVPTVDESGEPPAAADMQAAAETLISDLWVVRRALENYPQATSQLKSVGAQNQLEAQGGFAGFSQLFSLGLP